MWMSEAPRLMASVSTRLTSLTTGACSDSSSSVARSRSSSSSRTSRSLPVADSSERSSMTFFSSIAWVEP